MKIGTRMSVGFLSLVMLLLGHGAMGDKCDATSALSVLVACESALRKEGPEVPPPEPCCTGIKAFGMPCTCSIVTEEIEQIICIRKLVQVAKTCGSPLPPGSKCGN